MTDKTDIAELMLKMRNLADRIIDAEGENNNGEVGKIIEMYDAADTTFKAENILLVLSAFEEQRQRADANAQEIRKLEFQWEHRAPTQWAYDQACTALHAQRERAEKAEAELAALKGEQVSVAWYHATLTLAKSDEDKKSLPEKIAARYSTPLFTAPQKLIDLPYDVLFNAIAKSATPLGKHMSISVKDFKAAIEAAGGIVKDGE